MHAGLIDSMLDDALHIATGCLCPTPTDNLALFSDIQPAELCCQGATLSLANHSSLDPNHILHGQLTELLASSKERMKCRHLFVPALQKLVG